MFFLCHPVLEVVSSFFERQFRYSVKVMLDSCKFMHNNVHLLHLLREDHNFFRQIMRTATVRANWALSAPNTDVSCPSTELTVVINANVLRCFVPQICIPGVVCPRLVCLMDIAHFSLNWHLFLFLRFVTLIQVFVGLLQWKGMNAFQTFPLNFDLFMICKIGIYTANWLANYATCVICYIVRIILKQRFIFCLVQMALQQAAIVWYYSRVLLNAYSCF